MGAAMTRSEFRTLVRDIEDNGFTFVRTTKHQHLYADRCGNFVGIGKTPSDPRALANARADLRRAIRARTEEQHRTETENQGMNTNSTDIVDLTSLLGEPATPAAAELVECGRCGTSKTKDNFRIHYRTHQPFGMCKQCISEVKRRPPSRLPKLSEPAPARRSGAADVARAMLAKPAGPDPEAMASRLLIARHREEYDRLLVDMMTALGWES